MMIGILRPESCIYICDVVSLLKKSKRRAAASMRRSRRSLAWRSSATWPAEGSPSIIEICFKDGAWMKLNDQIIVLSKRRGQFKQIMRNIVGFKWCSDWSPVGADLFLTCIDIKREPVLGLALAENQKLGPFMQVLPVCSKLLNQEIMRV